MFTLNVVAAQANSSMARTQTLAVTAPNAERCCRTKFRKVSGGRPLAAARAEGSVSIREIVVLSSHHPGVGREVLDHRVVDQASGVDGRGLQLTGPLLRGDVLVADVAAGFLADDVGDLLLGEPLKARRVDDWGVGVSLRFEQGGRAQVGGVGGADPGRAGIAEAVGEHAGLSDRVGVQPAGRSRRRTRRLAPTVKFTPSSIISSSARACCSGDSARGCCGRPRRAH